MTDSEGILEESRETLDYLHENNSEKNSGGLRKMSDLGYLKNCLNSINESFKCRECQSEFETHSKALKHVVNEHGDVKDITT